MKALAIDCAVTKLSVAAKNESNTIKLTLDVGMKQSEKLLPAIDYVMKEAGLSAKNLDYTAVTLGPGSFTGLGLDLARSRQSRFQTMFRSTEFLLWKRTLGRIKKQLKQFFL